MLSLQVDDTDCEASVIKTIRVSTRLRFKYEEIVILYLLYGDIQNQSINLLLIHFLTHPFTHSSIHSQIDGCLELRVEAPFNINRWDCRGYRLDVNATVIENGTLTSITSIKQIGVTPFLATFTTIHQDTYIKPFLPFIAKVGGGGGGCGVRGVNSLVGLTVCLSFCLSHLVTIFLRHQSITLLPYQR